MSDHRDLVHRLQLRSSQQPDSILGLLMAEAAERIEALEAAVTLDECAVSDLANEFCRREIPNGTTDGDTLYTIYARRVAQWLAVRAQSDLPNPSPSTVTGGAL